MSDSAPASARYARLTQALSRVLSVIGAISLILALYVYFSPEPIDLPPERMSIDGPADASELGTSLAANLNLPLLPGNRIDLLVNGDQIFPAMLDGIRGAKESVNLLTYVYWRGEIAQTFARELAAAAQRGVKVRLLIDAFGGRSMDPHWIEEMKRAGVQVVWFRPLSWDHLRSLNNRTHRKVMVVDGRVAFTGGVGIAQEWTGNAQDADHWRDDHFRIQGPAVRHLQGSFAENWRQASGEVLAGAALFPPLPPAGSAYVIPLSTEPSESYSGIALTYWMLFRSASKQLHVATPYYVPDPDMGLGLTEAARRGVAVTLLIPGPYQDAAVVRYASRAYYRGLLEAGVRIFEYQPTLMHTKAVTVDGTWALVGSPNFDSRSFELNYENALVLYDSNVVHALDATFAHDLTRSREITLADVDSWSAWDRFVNKASLLLRAQM